MNTLAGAARQRGHVVPGGGARHDVEFHGLLPAAQSVRLDSAGWIVPCERSARNLAFRRLVLILPDLPVQSQKPLWLAAPPRPLLLRGAAPLPDVGLAEPLISSSVTRQS